MEENQNNSRSQKTIITILILAILALLIWIFVQRSGLNRLVREKENEKVELQKELDSVVTEHNKIKQAYGHLSDSLKSKDSLIQANAVEIRKLLDTQWEYNKVRKRLTMLQGIAQGYVRQIDSLYTVNRQLQAENEQIRQDFHNEQTKTKELVKDKQELTDKVNNAAFIRAYDISTGVFKLKGGSKEQPTDKASRTERLRVCFTLGENLLVKPGKRSLYICITRPDNVTVIKSKYDSFMYRGQAIPFSIRQDVTYDGKAQNLCSVWNKRESDTPAMKGKYSVKVYCEDQEIGSGTFELK